MNVMNKLTNKIFDISKIATNIKSLFTLDLNWGVCTDKTTSELIIYLEYKCRTFPCVTP